MSTQVTLILPDELYEHAERWAPSFSEICLRHSPTP